MPTYTTFKGVTNIGDTTFADILETNLRYFINWGLLNMGGFSNVNVPTSGQYGGLQHKLRHVTTPGFSAGQVWESFRKDWVWESGVEFTTQPIRVSGVYVGGTFVPTGPAGAYSHVVDHPNGRIIFHTAIPTTGVVHVNHSYRWAQVLSANARWFRDLQFRVFRQEQFSVGSGDWNTFGLNRVQLPAVVVEVVPRRSFYGLQLGGGQGCKQDVIFHCIAENPWDRDKLMDILSVQNDKSIYLFDVNRLADYDKFPLDASGSVAPFAPSYPQLVSPTGENGYRWRVATFTNTTTDDMGAIHPDLYWGTVRTTMEADFPRI